MAQPLQAKCTMEWEGRVEAVVRVAMVEVRVQHRVYSQASLQVLPVHRWRVAMVEPPFLAGHRAERGEGVS
jgi:hypothetical protein